MSSYETLEFPLANQQAIAPYLPPLNPDLYNEDNTQSLKPFITLTYATSLDSHISLTPTAPTPLSGPASKAMTHYLRANHDGILIGVGTAISDNPTLNSRISQAVNVGIDLQPRPIILDRNAKWKVQESSRMIVAARDGKGKAPWILVDTNSEHKISKSRRNVVEACGGQYIIKKDETTWLIDLRKRGLKSIMVEGGGHVINDLLNHKEKIDSLIVTVAPVFLGTGGVRICPERSKKRKRNKQQPAVKLKHVKWVPLERDVVMCSKVDTS